MRSSHLLLLAGLAMAGNAVYGQSTPCLTDEYYHQKSTEYPAMLEQEAATRYKTGTAQRESEDTTTYIIPVVFHVIHDGGPENIAKLRIDQQLITLNETYNLKNRDTQSIRKLFQPLTGNVRMKFVLAKRDPQGKCTDGINRIQSELTYDATDKVKALAQWNPQRYLNIWVVSNIENFSSGTGFIAGYSTFPWMASIQPNLDGILVDYHFVGRSHKVLTHEVGHFLGLYHTFEGACGGGDDIEDTPPASEANYGWNTTLNTCSNDQPDLPDMIENYMDYADYSYLFTQQQVQRLRHFVTLYRNSLISLSNVNYVTSPCNTTSIGDQEETLAGLDIYPNPANDHFTLTFPSEAPVSYQVSIIEPGGRQVLSRQVSGSAGNSATFSKAELGLKQGLYFVRVQSATGVRTVKLVVE
jgi:predicted Zn-dependent protease